MTQQLVNLHMFLGEDVHADFEARHCARHERTREIRECQPRIRRAHQHRAACVQPNHRFAGEQRQIHHAAAVLVAGKGGCEQRRVNVAHADRHARRVRKALEHPRPCVDVGGAVVAVHHGGRLAGGRRHHVDFGVHAGLERAGRVKQLRAFRRHHARVLARA